MTREIRDNLLKVTKALPETAETVYTDEIDLGAGEKVAGMDLLISAPALAVGELGDGDTMTYEVQTDSDPLFLYPRIVIPAALVQEGADGAGAAAATRRFALPSDADQYVRVAVTADGANDAADKSVTLEVLL
ncbi:MAG TPA: hypothetical protein VFH53_08710 [Phycisphaerae bacterium]|nr:hypothetical protein [Phycisphaerae bacterium]HUX15635.1 hypothetical protein [Phycisphaerae bacterium]